MRNSMQKNTKKDFSFVLCLFYYSDRTQFLSVYRLNNPLWERSKGPLFSRGLTQTMVLRKQWTPGILFKKVDLIK